MGLTYVDSCVLIDAASNRGERGALVRRVFEAETDDRFVTSKLVDLECMVRPLNRGKRDEIARMRGMLNRFPRVGLSDRTYDLAAHLRALHGLKTPDALHVAAASLNGCDRIWTSDRSMIRAVPDLAADLT